MRLCVEENMALLDEPKDKPHVYHSVCPTVQFAVICIIFSTAVSLTRSLLKKSEDLTEAMCVV